MHEIVLAVVDSLVVGLGDRQDHAHLGAAIAQTDRLVPFIAEMERRGMSQNFVVRIRGAVDTVRKSIYRTYYIQKIEYLPSVHVLIVTLAWAVIGLLTLLKTDGGIGSALIFGFASFLFVFVQHVISVFEQPFRHWHPRDGQGEPLPAARVRRKTARGGRSPRRRSDRARMRRRAQARGLWPCN